MRQRARLGMALFLLSEAVFFFLLILAYVYFRSSTVTAASGRLRVAETAIYTVCLLGSSVTMWRAAQSGSRAFLVATIVLAAAFLVGQTFEYARLYQQNITVSQSLFGTTFFTLTGLHGLHVIVGIVSMAVLFGARTFGEYRSIVFENVALYWVFVDLVWIVIFAVVYLGNLL